MTAFDFMANSFFTLVGVLCMAASILVIVITGSVIIRVVKGGAKNGKR